ncbi:MAG: hypothetical protein PHN45_03020 [Methylococcales bacterium]|nr:hypothetical protein [Methylococcales bacterium]MDD5753704.1 hypothetical protein [Methylococcales bacterium]
MKKKFILGLLFASVLTGCDISEKLGTPPQIADVNSVGCLVANDFYAVHFSAYLKPSQGNDREALLTPYCQELPDVGKAFFSADLIDRDIRKTPIGIRVVEIEKISDQPGDFKEIRELNHVESKIYSKGVVEAQADLDKKGDYALILLIGGEEAISNEDKLKITFHVGANPFNWLKLIASSVAALFVLFCGVSFYRKKWNGTNVKKNT